MANDGVDWYWEGFFSIVCLVMGLGVDVNSTSRSILHGLFRSFDDGFLGNAIHMENWEGALSDWVNFLLCLFLVSSFARKEDFLARLNYFIILPKCLSKFRLYRSRAFSTSLVFRESLFQLVSSICVRSLDVPFIQSVVEAAMGPCSSDRTRSNGATDVEV